ncbi:PREDICTED: uncharacterized protein LOC108549574 [Eufriesea mexicana]|uniref:uncharacterized protein LOC108549574 n=1 Tax=Eufriesea mexicana TaxID=516756 RepID=UPI00083BC1C9|nr:PREDICTED: uncharacterized protein LOC108549574 [Eufriesea mexicana]
MNFHIFILLTIGINCRRCYKVIAATENEKIIHRSLGLTTGDNKDVQALEKEISLTDLYSKQNSIRLEELDRNVNRGVDPSNRRSKILRSLAFLAGLSVGDLAGAASSDVKSYAKFSPLSVNVGASRVSPHVAAIYDPYPYVPYPYVFTTPLGFYPLWDPLRLQSISGIQNNIQPLVQNSPLLNLLGNRPTDVLDTNDEYVEAAQKIENVKSSSNTNKDTDKSAEFQMEDNRNAEEKIKSSPGNTCNMEKGLKAKQGSSEKSVFKEHESADASLTTLGLRAINTTEQIASTNTTRGNTTQIPDTSVTMSSAQNSTMHNNRTTPQFYGYYGGYPQNINHIELTTETYEQKYHGYEHINYNLPTYEKPVNFYSDERYNYYPAPPVDSYPSQFHQEHIPEYHSNHFKRFLYTSANTPPFVNSDFRPVV